MKKKESKKKWSIIFISVLLIGSMLFSLFIVMLDNFQGSLTYNDHTFHTTNTNTYITEINNKRLEFTYYPENILSTPLDTASIPVLKNAAGIIVVFDPNVTSDELIYVDVTRFEMESQFDKPVYYGITQNSTIYNIPLYNCTQATAQYPVIYLNMSSDVSITVDSLNPNCIYLNAKLLRMLEGKDRLVYAYYGIMN